MPTLYFPLILAATILVSGCSIKQAVKPAEFSPDMTSEICLIPAEGVREGFKTAYANLLKSKGFQTRELPSGSSPSSCSLSTTYIGSWSWDLALYMSYAKIVVYQRGQQVGQAEYDSRSGAGRTDKFINAQEKITELTNLLFPNGAADLKGVKDSNSEAGVSLMTKEAYQKQQLEQLERQGLPYAEYKRRYNLIMAD